MQCKKFFLTYSWQRRPSEDVWGPEDTSASLSAHQNSSQCDCNTQFHNCEIIFFTIATVKPPFPRLQFLCITENPPPKITARLSYISLQPEKGEGWKDTSTSISPSYNQPSIIIWFNPAESITAMLHQDIGLMVVTMVSISVQAIRLIIWLATISVQ